MSFYWLHEKNYKIVTHEDPRNLENFISIKMNKKEYHDPQKREFSPQEGVAALLLVAAFLVYEG